MQGLSRRTRFVYFWTLVLLFFIVTPILGFYAAGYRLGDNWVLVKKGGLFIDTGISKAKILLDKELISETGLFDKTYFIKDLTPGRYTIRVEKEGFQSWEKTVMVYPQSVTKFMPFLLPISPNIIPVPMYVSMATSSSATSSVKNIYNNEYDTVTLLFSKKETNRKVGATSTIIISNRVAIVIDKTGMIAEWQGSEEGVPYFFCEYITCAKRVRIPTPEDPILYVDFFPGRNDAALVTTPSGIYLVELDGRSGHAAQVFIQKFGINFRVSDRGEIFVKDGMNYYQVDPSVTSSAK
jgi:hypothetical protein